MEGRVGELEFEVAAKEQELCELRAQAGGLMFACRTMRVAEAEVAACMAQRCAAHLARRSLCPAGSVASVACAVAAAAITRQRAGAEVAAGAQRAAEEAQAEELAALKAAMRGEAAGSEARVAALQGAKTELEEALASVSAAALPLPASPAFRILSLHFSPLLSFP